MLHFEGVYQKCKVYVNGQFVGTHDYGYTPFRMDITNLVTKGNNVVAVRVDNSEQPNCRWYSGSGIYRHVWLETSDLLRIDDDGVFITTHFDKERSGEVSLKKAYVDMDVTLVNSSKEARTVSVSAWQASKHVTLKAGEKQTVSLSTTIDNPDLWSPSSPTLYNVQVNVVEKGRVIDEKACRYGVRHISYDAKRGLRLNGQPFVVNGACVHHDTGVLGAAALDAAEIRKVRLMKEAGFNLIRTSHNPSTRAFLDACDSIGMLVIDEIYDGWYAEKTKYDYHTTLDSTYRDDIKSMVMRDRNHPSIICWSIGNEVIERKDIRVVHTAKTFKNTILAYDRTRPVTEALCSWDSDWEIFDPHADVLDIVGYNYMMHKHESDHERTPERVMWQTESYPRDAFLNWQRTNAYPYIIGDIVWTGLDYLGESGIGQYYYEGEPNGEHYVRKHFPFHGAYCGDVDITGWRKPVSHYRDMLWNTPEGDNSIYLAVREPDNYRQCKISTTLWAVPPTWESWNWSGWEGKQIEAVVYTKSPAVNLYLNGKLIASKKVSNATEYKTIIPIPYTPGELKAVAVDAQGKEGAVAVLRTSGEAHTVRLTPDRKTIHADGQDLCFITAEVIDANGSLVTNANELLNVKVTGAGTLQASASASMKDLEPMTSPRVTTFNGRALIVLRSMQKRGNITLTVSGKHIKNASISVKGE